MKKFGFTLAEVLITLGIIGIVAALTAPALVKNSGQAKIGPSLAKFVNTFETACEQLMHDQDISKIQSLGDWTITTTLGKELSKYMIMTKINKNLQNNYRYYAPDGTDATYAPNDSFLLKDGSLIMFYGSDYDAGNELYKPQSSYKGSYAYVLVDINGPSGNNKAGKEVFKFYIDESGVLVPCGSNAHKFLKSSYEPKCSTTSNSIKNGLDCTGKIADNGWKADY